ncbi:hypothetical protein RvY_00665-2 [Ramazzottius varieornatus]|nr:hypothetical protein RvY_00665-2 [Ramazzottius varieornatus]
MTVMRKEQEDFCSRLDNDLNHAIAQWKSEVLMLRATVQDLEERKANLGVELNKVMQRLHLLDDRRVQDEVAEDQLKFEREVTEAVSKLERFGDDKKGDLMEAHQELDQGLTDLEKITKHLKKLHKENERLVRENADLVEEMSEISAKQLSFQLRLNRILSRVEKETPIFMSKEYLCLGDN